jgi:GT2 family glycosyltransferase
MEGTAAAGPRIAAVVLTWNGREDTLACLHSLAQASLDTLTTIVVDNGSSDGTEEAVRRGFPSVQLIRSKQNLGFAEGNNLGLRRALQLGADYVLVLNNDTLLDPDAIPVLVAEARRRPDAGALCPLIYYADPPDLIWYAGAEYDPRRGYNPPQTGYKERDRGQYATVREITRATGAAMLVPRAVLERVGLLDAELFLHVEDVDWSQRMLAAGYRILFVPRARIWHKVSADTGGENSPTLAYYGMRNRLEVSARHAPLGGLAGARREAVTVLAELAHARRGRRRLDSLRGALEGWRDFRQGRLGPRGQTVPRSTLPAG